MSIVSEYLEVAGVVRNFLATSDVAKYWDYPSALEEWTVAGLAGHLARPVLNLSSVLAEPVPLGSPRHSAVDYYCQMPREDASLDSPAALTLATCSVATTWHCPRPSRRCQPSQLSMRSARPRRAAACGCCSASTSSLA